MQAKEGCAKNAVVRSLVRILAAVSAVFSLVAFAQPALVNNHGYSPALIATTGSPVGQALPCDASASVPATLVHGSLALPQPPRARSGAVAPHPAIHNPIDLQFNQSAHSNGTHHFTSRGHPFSAHAALNNTASYDTFPVATTDAGQLPATLTRLHGGSGKDLTYSSML